MANLSLTIQQDLLDKLREEAVGSDPKKTVTALVQEILARHYIPKEMPPTLTPADLEAIRNLFRTEGVFSHPSTQLIIEEEPIQKGLIIPDMTKTRLRPDPDIKNSFHLSHDIRPGDGVTMRLKAAGIDPLSIVKAKRNKRRGVEYDKSLEQYFDLL